MEPPQILGGAEECHSSESGWTMYIGSPIDEDGQSDDGENDNVDYEGTQVNPKDESDDSMASDASSGPSHYGINPLGKGERGYGLTHFQQEADVEYDEDKYCLDEKVSKTKENEIAKKRVEKKEIVFINSKGKDPAQGGGNDKVRKNHRVGKKK